MQRPYDIGLPARFVPGAEELENRTHGIGQSQTHGEALSLEQRPVVVVIDPRSLSREGMVQLLETSDRFSIIAVAQVGDLAPALAAVRGEAVILLSLGSLEMSDEKVRGDIAILSRTLPHAPIIVVCDREDSHQVGEALSQGVRGYIPTTLTARVVVEAVRLVQAGGTFVPAGAFAEALTRQRIDQRDPAPEVAINLSGLTPRQREVFDLLRRGKPNKIIAHELSMCESTVKVHVRQIMRKLHASNRTQAAFLAARVAGQGAI